MSNSQSNHVLSSSLVLVSLLSVASAQSSSAGSLTGADASRQSQGGPTITSQSAGALTGIGASERKAPLLPPFTSAHGSGASKHGDKGSGGVYWNDSVAVGQQGGASASGHGQSGISVSAQNAGALRPLQAGASSSSDLPPIIVDPTLRVFDKEAEASDEPTLIVDPTVPQDKQGAGKGAASDPISVSERGGGYGQIVQNLEAADGIQGQLIGESGQVSYVFKGTLTRVYADSILPFDRPWGFVYGDLYAVEQVSGAQQYVGQLEGEWEYQSTSGLMWGALIDANTGQDMGLFRGQFRAEGYEHDGAIEESFSPAGASEHGDSAVALGPPTSTSAARGAQAQPKERSSSISAAGAQAGQVGHQSHDEPAAADAQTIGAIRLDWELWD